MALQSLVNSCFYFADHINPFRQAHPARRTFAPRLPGVPMMLRLRLKGKGFTMKLQDKIVLVTGGNSGIGRTIALRAAGGFEEVDRNASLFGRMGTPDEIARVVVFLASSEAS